MAEAAAVAAEVAAAVTAPVIQATPGNAQVTVTWSAVSGATSYNLYWSMNAGVTTTNGNKIAGASSPYVHSSRTNNQRYYYIATAASSGGESAASPEVSAVPATNPAPASPSISAEAVSTTAVTISWPAVSGAASYNLYYGTSPGVTTSGTKVAGITSPYTQLGLTCGTKYYFVATAVSAAASESTTSSEVGATPAPYIKALVFVNSDGTPINEQVWVNASSTGSTISTGATVTLIVNGIANSIPWSASNNSFSGGAAVPAGASIVVNVTYSGVTYSASATQYSSYPTVSQPTPGAAWDHMTGNIIAWSGGSPTTGSSILAAVIGSSGIAWPLSSTNPQEVPIGAGGATVPPMILTAGGAIVLVGIATTGSVSDGAVDGIAFSKTLPHSSLYVGGGVMIPIIVN